ncbi:MAG: histidine phosphatase family protein [Pseudomonadota bacterium]|nr:histidine phosphatase family protein [Pseudomonadota bacterium]
MSLRGSTSWIFLRHGESVANAAGWLSGWEDVVLTARGEEQARLAAELLAGVQIGRCLVSDLGRARHTARLALNGRAVPVHTLADLRERHLGVLQRAPIVECTADGRRERYLLPWDLGPPGGESRSTAVRRALAALRHWDDGTPTLVVGHGSVLRGIVALFDGHGPDDLHALPPTANAEPMHRRGPVPWL